MTVEFVPFEADHLLALDVQPEQVAQLPENAAARRDLMLGSFVAYTALAGDTPVACGGLIPFWAGRALAWTYLGVGLRPYMWAVHQHVYQVLEDAPVRRIEAWVKCDHPAAHRWIRLLGFECEAERMRGFMPNGDDFALYARLK